MGLRRGVGTVLKKQKVIGRANVRAASSVEPEKPGLFGSERGGGVLERGLNKLGRYYHSNFALFDFSKHAEIQTRFDLDHISAGNESSQTNTGNILTHDKLCKWWTVEGLPGAGKGAFAAQFSESTGVKNFGTSHLLWELERLKTVCGQDAMYNTWKDLNDEGLHYLAMREVSLENFYANPHDPVHSCRMQDHMKSQRHIHSMDALRHLLLTAEGVITDRTHHSDYCYAYALMKMGYMSKNFYEMRYTVSHAAADGSGTATDLTPNVSFMIDISPEESFESIKARGNEAEIATCNLDFLKYLDEAYKTFWSEDMNNKGCTVFTRAKGESMDDLVDFIEHCDEDELRHVYSRWSYAGERQTGNNNRSQIFGDAHAYWDFASPYYANRFRRTKHELTAFVTPGGKAGNFYEKVLQNDLVRGPAYTYEIMNTFHPWDELSESHSALENFEMMNCYMSYPLFYDGPRKGMPWAYHPEWRPKDKDWFGHGHARFYNILLGSCDKNLGDQFNQKNQHHNYAN